MYLHYATVAKLIRPPNLAFFFFNLATIPAYAEHISFLEKVIFRV